MNNIITTNENNTTERSFHTLGIAPKILDTLTQLNFETPTPIQYKAIPIAIEGKDVIGIAQTGTGKTLSFAIPMLQRLLTHERGIGLVMVPTRELAIQIDEVFQEINRPFGIETACLIGGASMFLQLQALKKNPRIIIATPGRLIDHTEKRKSLLRNITMLVLDEADRMLDMGFAQQINKIMEFLPRERQTMLFSATIPRAIIELTSKYMKLPVSLEITPSGTTVENVTQELFIVKKESKLRLLEKILKQYSGSILLFSRTRHNANKITKALRNMGHYVTEIHSSRSLAQRCEALEGFKTGKYRILVATDIAARGIDVSGIELVINYDLPEEPENYVHRIGRTARAGSAGHAISFAMPDQSRDVRNIEKLIRKALPISKHPEVPCEEFAKSKVVFSSNRRRSRSTRSCWR